MNAMEISLTGLDVEWRRLEVIAANLAHAETAITPDGHGYQPVRLVSGPGVSFADLATDGDLQLRGVRVLGMEPEKVAPHRVYEPANPMADATGFVSYTGIDHAGEMLLMAKTSRVYEANLAAFNAARQMYAKALEIGKR